ncbi:MAG: hypothetical protein OHK0053_01380 [Microscillaceae bacterium]
MSSQKEQVTEMIHRYVEEVGLKREEAYDAEKKSWHWRIGSARIQVYIETLQFSGGHFREYLRVFSPLLQIPAGQELVFYRHLLELNDSKLGVKLTIMPNSDWVYATYERDILGMDYEELRTCIADLEWWADKLDDELKTQFPG